MNDDFLEKTLYFHNPWWIEKKISSEFLTLFRRPILNRLHYYLDSLQRVIIIKGPRRTGKTTLLYQMVENLILKGVVKFEPVPNFYT